MPDSSEKPRRNESKDPSAASQRTTQRDISVAWHAYSWFLTDLVMRVKARPKRLDAPTIARLATIPPHEASQPEAAEPPRSRGEQASPKPRLLSHFRACIGMPWKPRHHVSHVALKGINTRETFTYLVHCDPGFAIVAIQCVLLHHTSLSRRIGGRQT